MDGFFVTINCSKVLDSNETSYKIFIDKNKMSIVYELMQWIRFMFSLEKCFFLIHEDTVIHELEDIKVLEILNVLEIRPCLRLNCIHQKMEKALFSRLNLYTYWNEVRVHKLFQDRCNYIIQKVSNNQHNQLNINEKSKNFILRTHQNLEESNKSNLTNNHLAVTSPLELTHNLKNDRTPIIELRKTCINNENQLDLEVNSIVGDQNKTFNEVNTPEMFSQDLESSGQPTSNTNLNMVTKSSDFSSVSKKQEIQCEPKKNFTGKKNSRRMGIPFSLGALLSDIREKAQIQGFEEKQDVKKLEELSDSVCLDDNNTEDDNVSIEKPCLTYNESSFKRKRKRKHKRQSIKKPYLNPTEANLSSDYYEPPVCVKPNHIRFSDVDDAVETETFENHSMSINQESDKYNSLQVSNNKTPQMVTLQLKTESDSLSKENKSNKVCSPIVKTQNEHYEKLIDQSSELQDIDMEKKELDGSQQDLSDLESLKQKIRHPSVCMRFY